MWVSVTLADNKKRFLKNNNKNEQNKAFCQLSSFLVSELGRIKQEVCEFETTLGYTMRFHFKISQPKWNKTVEKKDYTILPRDPCY